jgi:hypothetical protein
MGKGGRSLMGSEMFIGKLCHHDRVVGHKTCVSAQDERRNQLASFFSSASRASCRSILR